MKSGISSVVTLAMAAMIAGCGAPELEPAPAATPTQGPGDAVVEQAEGVRLEAQVDAWGARPQNLDQEMTPVRVEIRNESDRPLRIRYQEFVLAESDGTARSAVPPFNLDEEVTRVTDPAYAPTGFTVAPHLGPYYGTGFHHGAHHGFAHDPFYYNTHYPYYSTVTEVQLPTDDMLRFAMPEGVVDPGGQITGFLYFERVQSDVERARLHVDLVDASTGDQFGEIEIPFTVSQ